jgi:hypothetical protein
MSLPIGDIQKVRAMLFVRILIIILQRMSRSIQTKEACLPVITAASEEAANKSYIRHYTSDGSSSSMASAKVCSCQSKW